MAQRTGFENRINNTPKPTRPSIIRSKEEVEKENEEYEAEERKSFLEQEQEAKAAEKKKYLKYKVPVRKTYLLDPISVRALEYYSTDENETYSSIITNLLLKAIPKDYWIRARNDVIKGELTPSDYLDDVKKPTIQGVYYHIKDKG